MTTSLFRPVSLCLAAALGLPVVAVGMSVAIAPAHAWIVFDPRNYVQNVLSAARTLEQINHQIASLQNEATMLVNQARNLASLPFSALQQLQQNVRKTQQLIGQAQNIAFDVDKIDAAFAQDYASASISASDRDLVAQAQTRWRNTVGGLQDALRVQAGVVGNIEANRTALSDLVSRSQGATGALQAAQAGNQLLALQSQQLSDLVALLAANGRADALTEAERSAAAEQGREQRRRFLAPGPARQAGPVRMFNGN